MTEFTPLTAEELAALKKLAEGATPIPGFAGYCADCSGHVWSLTGWRGRERKLMREDLNHKGYLRVRLTLVSKKRKHYQVHTLVCLAFHGVPPTKQHEVCHLNGIRTDNRPENLRWGTRKDNAADRDAHGRTARGERNGFAKLRDEVVVRIRALSSQGKTQRQIAAIVGVQQTTVGHVVRGISWGHVK